MYSDEPMLAFGSTTSPDYDLTAEIAEKGKGQYKVVAFLTPRAELSDPPTIFLLLHNSYTPHVVKMEHTLRFETTAQESYWLGVVIPSPDGALKMSTRLAINLETVKGAGPNFVYSASASITMAFVLHGPSNVLLKDVEQPWMVYCCTNDLAW